MKSLTQRERILKLLQDNPAGINSFGVARELALQLPTRVLELRRAGHNIISIRQDNGSVDYVLTETQERPQNTEIKFIVENGIYKAIL
jgi:hypothetical protein